MNTLDNALALFGETPADTQPVKASKKKTKQREETDYGQDLVTLAALKLVAKALTETAKIVDAELKQKALREFATKMIEKKVRPDSFIATGKMFELDEQGNPVSQLATASGCVTLGRAGSKSALDEPTVDKLKKLGVEADENVVVPERLVLNPEILQDQEKLAAIAEAIQGHPKLKGVQVVKRQDAVVVKFAGEGSIEALAKKFETVEEAVDVLSRISFVSIGKFQMDDLKDPTELMRRALQVISAVKLLPSAKDEEAA